MKKSAIFVLIFTFVIIGMFYSISNKPKTKKIPNSISTPTVAVTSTPVPTSVPASAKMTVDQVVMHNTRNDCFLVINSNVYDVSLFISEHPGGQGKIIGNCGQEVTGIFAQIHSNFAWDLLAKYKIGQI